MSSLSCILILCALLGAWSKLTQQQKDILLEVHNKYRCMHGVEPVAWDNDIAKQAQDYANKCTFKHSSNNNIRVGENLYRTSGSVNVSHATTRWYDEVEDYKYNDPGFTSGTGHFTQIVWKDTSLLGCGVCTEDGILVCQYGPPGNITPKEHFEENVLKVSTQESKCTSSKPQTDKCDRNEADDCIEKLKDDKCKDIKVSKGSIPENTKEAIESYCDCAKATAKCLQDKDCSQSQDVCDGVSRSNEDNDAATCTVSQCETVCALGCEGGSFATKVSSNCFIGLSIALLVLVFCM